MKSVDYNIYIVVFCYLKAVAKEVRHFYSGLTTKVRKQIVFSSDLYNNDAIYISIYKYTDIIFNPVKVHIIQSLT